MGRFACINKTSPNVLTFEAIGMSDFLTILALMMVLAEVSTKESSSKEMRS